MKEKISVIVPIYNVSQYLEKCLYSIINNTYKNLEIICINDGSTDNSMEVLERIAKEDERIFVINQENRGLSEARNVGLRKATAKWIAFIDSDDWIHERYFEVMMGNSENVDIVVADYRIVGSDVKTSEIDKINTFELSLEQGYKNEAIKKMVWGRIYKREVIGEIVFPQNVGIGEDTIFNMNIFDKNETLTIRKVNVELYYYYSRSNSVMHVYPPSVWAEMCRYYLGNMENVKRTDLYLNEAFKTMFLYRYEGVLAKANFQEEYWKLAKKCLYYLNKEKRIGIVKKIYYYVASISFYVYRFSCVVRDKTVLDWERTQKDKYEKMRQQGK